MRIAVSGTHAMGKSTLAEDFVQNHPEFVLELKPYHVLQEQFGIAFAEEPTQESFKYIAKISMGCFQVDNRKLSNYGELVKAGLLVWNLSLN